MLFKHGRKLVGGRTTKSRLTLTRVHESQFADDAALFTTSRGILEQTSKKFAGNATQ